MGCGDETRRGGTGDWGGTGFRCVHSTGREPSWLCSGNDCRKLVSKGGPRRVRLRSRVDRGRQPRRQPFYPGFCGQWWTQYRGPAGYVDVSITIYRTSRQVDAPLREPAYLSLRLLGNGARVRSASDGSGRVRHAQRLREQCQFLSPGRRQRVPKVAGGPDLPVGVHMRIHRLVHQAVIRAG